MNSTQQHTPKTPKPSTSPCRGTSPQVPEAPQTTVDAAGEARRPPSAHGGPTARSSRAAHCVLVYSSPLQLAPTAFLNIALAALGGRPSLLMRAATRPTPPRYPRPPAVAHLPLCAPPGPSQSFLFGPVWTALYIMQGTASWFIWKGKGECACASACVRGWVRCTTGTAFAAGMQGPNAACTARRQQAPHAAVGLPEVCVAACLGMEVGPPSPP